MTTDSDRLEEIKANMPVEPYIENEEDFVWLVARVEELEGKLAAAEKERDEWEEQANQQCIRNDKLQVQKAQGTNR